MVHTCGTIQFPSKKLKSLFLSKLITKYLVRISSINEVCMNVFFNFLEGNHMVPQVCTITWIFSLDIFAKLNKPDASFLVLNFIFLNFGIEIGFFEIPLLNVCWSSQNAIFSYFGNYQILVGMFNFKFEHSVE